MLQHLTLVLLIANVGQLGAKELRFLVDITPRVRDTLGEVGEAKESKVIKRGTNELE